MAGEERAWAVALGRRGFHGRLFAHFVTSWPVGVGDSGIYYVWVDKPCPIGDKRCFF